MQVVKAFKEAKGCTVNVMYFEYEKAPYFVKPALNSELVSVLVIGFFDKNEREKGHLDRWYFEGSSEEGEDKYLQGRPVRTWPLLTQTSKYVRPELDTVAKHGDRVVNPTQKTFEEGRWLVRHFCAPKQGVMSLCDGSGTMSIAALREGRDVIAVDYNQTQLLTSYDRVMRMHKKDVEIMKLHADSNSQQRSAGSGPVSGPGSGAGASGPASISSPRARLTGPERRLKAAAAAKVQYHLSAALCNPRWCIFFTCCIVRFKA